MTSNDNLEIVIRRDKCIFYPYGDSESSYSDNIEIHLLDLCNLFELAHFFKKVLKREYFIYEDYRVMTTNDGIINFKLGGSEHIEFSIRFKIYPSDINTKVYQNAIIQIYELFISIIKDDISYNYSQDMDHIDEDFLLMLVDEFLGGSDIEESQLINCIRYIALFPSVVERITHYYLDCNVEIWEFWEYFFDECSEENLINHIKYDTKIVNCIIDTYERNDFIDL